MFSFDIDTLPRLDGKLAVVTGANSGLGLQTSWMLAHRGAKVVMACRSPERAAAAVETVRARVPAAEVHTLALDLASLASVREAAAALHAGPRVSVLVNNAGVMALPYHKTADGFEMQLGTNHLGHFALTGLLFDHLDDGARVVNVASGMHRAGRMRWSDLDGERGYDAWAWYGQSKLANLLFTYGMARRLAAASSTVLAVAAHPGYAATNLQHAGPKMEGSAVKSALMTTLNTLFAQSDEHGAWPQVYAAAAPGVESGQYFGPAFLDMWGAPRVCGSSAASKVEADWNRLWEVSEARTGVQFLS